MLDKSLVLEILKQVLASLERVERRFRPVKTVEAFVATEEGLEKLDAISMQLIALGEALKNLDRKTGADLLSRYPEIEW